jgi:hypothetical protein
MKNLPSALPWKNLALRTKYSVTRTQSTRSSRPPVTADKSLGRMARSILFRVAQDEFVMALVAGPAQIAGSVGICGFEENEAC